MSLKVSGLFLYPIKSCAGLSVAQFVMGEEGAEIALPSGRVMDRGWMFVNPDGDFQTQRNHPAMALLKTGIENDRFFLEVADRRFEIPLALENPRRKRVQVWGKQIDAAVVEGDLSKAVSDFLKTPVELVQFDSQCKREALVKGKGIGVGTRFTDSQPYLVISEESLKDLNSKLTTKIGPERFRANIWISGAGYAYREDQYKSLDHDSYSLEATKPCARCKIITVDVSTGRIEDSEPLKVLAQYRRRETQVYFGQYFISREYGAVIRQGDPLEPIQTG